MKHKHDHGTNILNMDNMAQQSPLSHVDGRVKILFAIAMLVLCIGCDNVVTSLFIAISMVVMMVGLCRLHLRQVWKLMQIPVGFIVLSCVTIWVQVTTALDVAGLRLFGLCFYVSETSTIQALELFFKAYGAITCLYFLNVTTTVQSMIHVCYQWHCPKILVELMYLIYRYLFVLLDMQQKMVISAKSRMGYVNYRRTWYTFGRIGGNVLIQSFKRSSACFDAMESRLYDGDIRFYTEEIPVQKIHAVYAILYVALTCAVGVLGGMLWNLF